MVLGIGSDLIEIDRIRKSIASHGAAFLEKLFTKEEQLYCQKYKDPAFSFAGRFAAKEAIAKALGCGFGLHLGWLDIEILPESSSGKPVVFFSEKAKKHFNSPQILLTISHDKERAMAVALWLSK